MFSRKPKKTVEEVVDIESQLESDGTNKASTKKPSFFSYFAGKGLLDKKSRFADWQRDELVEVLVNAGTEVREERNAQIISLIDECDRVFNGREMPKKPKLPDKMARFRMNYCAAKIQNAWLKKRNRQRKSLLKHKSKTRIDSDEDNDSDDMKLEDMERMNLLEEFGSDESSEEGEEVDIDQEGLEEIMQELNDAMNEYWGEGDDAGNLEPVGILSEAQKQETTKLLTALEQPFKMPSWDRARRSQDYLHPRKGGKGGARFQVRTTNTGRHCPLGNCGEQCDLWEEGMVSEFGMFGSGVTNYFKFLKWTTWVFAVLTIISLPQLLTNIFSNNYFSKALLSLSRTTVGNLAPQVLNATLSIRVPFCQDNLFFDECDLDRKRLSYFYAVIDAAISFFVLVAFVWLRYYERIEEVNVDKNTIFASMYTIQVRNLPPACTEFQLTQHFNNILGGQFPIVSINFAHRCELEVEKCAARGVLIREKMRLIQLHRQKCQNAKFSIKDDEKKLKEMLQKHKISTLIAIKKIDANIAKYDTSLQELGEHIADPDIAFITFEDSVAAHICVDLYARSLFDRWRFDKRLLLDGKRLNINMAPEPSLIIWENLEHGTIDRLLRKCVTLAAAILLIIVSLAVTLSDKLLEMKFGQFSSGSLCPADFRDWDHATQIAAIEADSTIVHCYCQNLDSIRQSRDPHCSDYFNAILRAQLLAFASSFVVLVISTLIEFAIRYFVEFEKHHSEDKKQRSIFLRLFLLQYLNSSIVFLVRINNPAILDLYGVPHSNQSTQFSTHWYRSAGVSIILVQLGNIFFCQQQSIYEYFAFHTNLKAVEKTSTLAVTQSELNEAHLGPEFELSYRYATILSTIFLCFTFASGIPLLYLLTAICCYVFFYVDKYLFIKLYKSPHRFSARIGKQATMLIPLGVALHLLGAVWVLADPAVFSSSSDTHAQAISQYSQDSILQQLFSKISLKQTFPLFLFAGFIIVSYISYYSLRFVWRLILQLRELLMNGGTKERIAELRELHSHGNAIPFTKAVQRNIIKGLASYNLLQNPVYKRKFAITWNFAFKHQDIKSVMYMTSHQIGEDDDDVDRMHKLIRKEAKDKEYLAKLSRSNEAGVIGNFNSTDDNDDNNDNDNNGRPSSGSLRIFTKLSAGSNNSGRIGSGRLGESSGNTSARRKPGLQRMNSMMQRQQLVMDDIIAGDEAENKEEEKQRIQKKISDNSEYDDSPRFGARSSPSSTPDMNGLFTFPSDRMYNSSFGSARGSGSAFGNNYSNNNNSADYMAALSSARKPSPTSAAVASTNVTANTNNSSTVTKKPKVSLLAQRKQSPSPSIDAPDSPTTAEESGATKEKTKTSKRGFFNYSKAKREPSPPVEPAKPTKQKSDTKQSKHKKRGDSSEEDLQSEFVGTAPSSTSRNVSPRGSDRPPVSSRSQEGDSFGVRSMSSEGIAMPTETIDEAVVVRSKEKLKKSNSVKRKLPVSREQAEAEFTSRTPSPVLQDEPMVSSRPLNDNIEMVASLKQTLSFHYHKPNKSKTSESDSTAQELKGILPRTPATATVASQPPPPPAPAAPPARQPPPVVPERQQIRPNHVPPLSLSGSQPTALPLPSEPYTGSAAPSTIANPSAARRPAPPMPAYNNNNNTNHQQHAPAGPPPARLQLQQHQQHQQQFGAEDATSNPRGRVASVTRSISAAPSFRTPFDNADLQNASSGSAESMRGSSVPVPVVIPSGAAYANHSAPQMNNRYAQPPPSTIAMAPHPPAAPFPYQQNGVNAGPSNRQSLSRPQLYQDQRRAQNRAPENQFFY